MSEMKLIMESWRTFLREQEDPPPQPQSIRQRAIGGLKSIRNKLAKGFDKLDGALQQDYCEKKFPQLLSAQGDIETWGDLLATLNCGIQYKNRKAFFDILTNQIPGINAAKEVFSKANDSADFILKMYQVDDDDRPEGNLSKLDMDDYVTKMLDAKVETEFIKSLIVSIGQKPPDARIDPDWDITQEIEKYLRDSNSGRTVVVPDST
jgi:hypothetical protein